VSLPKVEGFACGYTGSVGGSLAGFVRAHKLPRKTQPTGKQGQGRARTLALYTCRVTRLSDRKMLEEMVGPGYHSKKEWQAARDQTFEELMRQLGWKG
jgi:hypothetical protein